MYTQDASNNILFWIYFQTDLITSLQAKLKLPTSRRNSLHIKYRVTRGIPASCSVPGFFLVQIENFWYIFCDAKIPLYYKELWDLFLINGKSRDRSLNSQNWLLISQSHWFSTYPYFSVLPKNPIYHIVAYHIWNANTNYPIFFLLFCKWFLKLYL